ncbi:MAG: hypothetical protein ACI9FR_001261 [Cryomorphaceae bacterium]|jgi:hypothetical protein
MQNQKIITQGLRHLGHQEALEVCVQPNVELDRISVEFSESTIFVVPQGVEQLKIVVIGASGETGNGFGVLLNNGGEGRSAVSNIDSNPDESLEIFVGVRGQDGGQPKGGIGGSSTSGFEGGAAASGTAGGGGGASGAIRILGEEVLVVAGGGAGSEYSAGSSGGGACGTGTLEQGLSVNGGGTANGRVVISYKVSRKLKNEDETSLGAST